MSVIPNGVSKQYAAAQVTACIKVLSFAPDTGLESLLLLVYHLFNNGLFAVGPDLHQSLLQLIQVMYWLLVHSLLHTSRNLIG